MPAPPAIDHIIILLPYRDVTNPPSWLTDHFTISPGGRHADGKTENKLIILADGSYIELIAFIDDSLELRSGHWWDKEYGIVDYALTTQEKHFDPAVNERLKSTGTDVRYQDSLRGGRTRPDGVDMIWEVTFPIHVPRGLVPFWCHDVTDRIRRVPVSERSTTHPSGVTGVAGVISRPRGSISAIDHAVAAITDSKSGPKYGLSTVLQSNARAKPCLLIDGTNGPELELLLQVHADAKPGNILRKIGNGTVKINFVQA